MNYPSNVHEKSALKCIITILCLLNYNEAFAFPRYNEAATAIEGDQFSEEAGNYLVDPKLGKLDDIVARLEKSLRNSDDDTSALTLPVITDDDWMNDYDRQGDYQNDESQDILEDDGDWLEDPVKRLNQISPFTNWDHSISKKATSMGAPDLSSYGNTLENLHYLAMSKRAGSRSASKRYNPYSYLRRRSCNFSQLTAEHIVEYLRSGRICGRRVTNVRFALTGKK